METGIVFISAGLCEVLSAIILKYLLSIILTYFRISVRYFTRYNLLKDLLKSSGILWNPFEHAADGIFIQQVQARTEDAVCHYSCICSPAGL